MIRINKLISSRAKDDSLCCPKPGKNIQIFVMFLSLSRQRAIKVVWDPLRCVVVPTCWGSRLNLVPTVVPKCRSNHDFEFYDQILYFTIAHFACMLVRVHFTAMKKNLFPLNVINCKPPASEAIHKQLDNSPYSL